mmetsp:Transcript_11389/g.22568  ORF Transcript_11389/g.22568 Transcript_11389/m.22568 type:complete len:492 (+) Transcript_11389:108-1583(+)
MKSILVSGAVCLSTVSGLAEVLPPPTPPPASPSAPPPHAAPLLFPSHLQTKIASQAAKSERRAAERLRVSRDTCPRCSRPPVLCVCDALPSQRIRLPSTSVLVLQHPNEFRRRSLSTVPLLPLVLEDCEVAVGYSFGPGAEKKLPGVLAEYLGRGGRPLLLYPGPDAISLDRPPPSPDGAPSSPLPPLPMPDGGGDGDGGPHRRLLVLIDGTWSESVRMVLSSADLVSRCTKVQFASESASIYDVVRKEPEAHCLSTLEACARALVLLEPPSSEGGGDKRAEEARRYLEGAMRCMVETKMRVYRERNSPEPRFQRPHVRAEGRRERVREIEDRLFAPAGDGHGGGLPRPLGDDGGATLRRLAPSDGPAVDARWEHRSDTSPNKIHRLIAGPSVTLGVDAGGVLVASVLQGEDGALSMLHVAEGYRRRGYGRALVAEASDRIAARGQELVAYVRDGNAASEALFSKLGWARADPSEKKRTGRRRAKRKWILE